MEQELQAASNETDVRIWANGLYEHAILIVDQNLDKIAPKVPMGGKHRGTRGHISGLRARDSLVAQTWKRIIDSVGSQEGQSL